MTQLDSIKGGWLLRAAGHVVVLGDKELDELAQALAFRLRVKSIQRVGSGVALHLGNDAWLHLCYSDEAEEFGQEIASFAR